MANLHAMRIDSFHSFHALLAIQIQPNHELRRSNRTLKIGLPPLNNTATTSKKEGSSTSTAIHAPPTNTAAENEARQRIEDAQAKRDVRERLQRLEEENKRYSPESAFNFAARMMQQNKKSAADDDDDADKSENTKKRKKKKKSVKNAQLSIPTDEEEENNQDHQYTSKDLQGIKVSHDTTDFTAGSTTILTLADKSILEIDPNSKKTIGFDSNIDEHELINVDINEDSKALENLLVVEVKVLVVRNKSHEVDLPLGQTAEHNLLPKIQTTKVIYSHHFPVRQSHLNHDMVVLPLHLIS